MWCNIAVNKSPIILPYVLQCISHTHILNHSQFKDTAWEEAFYAIEEGIFFYTKAYPQIFLTDNFGILVLLSLPIFDQWGTLLAFILWRIKSKSNPKMSCPYNKKILAWQNSENSPLWNTCKSLISKYIIQILRKVTQKEVIVFQETYYNDIWV